jgi:hypothetical protein
MNDEPAPTPKDAIPNSQADGQSEAKGPEAVHEAFERLGEGREYFVYWAAAEFDRLKLRLRKAAVWGIVGLAAMVVLLAILMTAAGLLLVGLAELVAVWVGGRLWLGMLLVGGGVFVLIAAGLAIGMWAWQKSAFEATRERFAARRRRQKAKFGQSVEPTDDPINH